MISCDGNPSADELNMIDLIFPQIGISKYEFMQNAEKIQLIRVHVNFKFLYYEVILTFLPYQFCKK
jgi:hypothetical protein